GGLRHLAERPVTCRGRLAASGGALPRRAARRDQPGGSQLRDCRHGGVFPFFRSPCKKPGTRLQSAVLCGPEARRRAEPMKPEQILAEEATAIQRLLASLVGWVVRFPGLVLVAALALAGLSAYASLTRLEYRPQRSDLVNPNKDYQKRWQAYLAEFGDDDDIVAVVQGADRESMKRAIDQLAAGIARCPQRFDRLFYRVDLSHVHNR